MCLFFIIQYYLSHTFSSATEERGKCLYSLVISDFAFAIRCEINNSVNASGPLVVEILFFNLLLNQMSLNYL